MYTIFYAIPLLLGYSEEKQILYTTVVEQLVIYYLLNFLRTFQPEPFTTIEVILSEPVQLYSAELTVQVRLFGIR